MVDLIVETPEGPIHQYLPGPNVIIYVKQGKMEVRWLDPSLSAENIGRKILEAILNLDKRSEVGEEGEPSWRSSHLNTRPQNGD